MSSLPWKKITSNLLYEHPRLKLLEDTWQLSSGETLEWLRYENQSDFALVLAFEAQTILTIKHFNPALEAFLAEFPCGAIDQAESPVAAAKRELLEETGYQAKTLEFLGSFVANPRRSSSKGHVFLARDLTQQGQQLELAELIELEWRPVSEFEAALSQGLQMSADALAAWALFKTKALS